MNVLSVVPFIVKPPPSAVKSVAPPAENTIEPAVLLDALVIVICVALSILVMVVVPPNAPVPLVLVTTCPANSPTVLVIPVIVVVVVVPVIVPTNPVELAIDASSIFLSSTVKVDELIVVVVPLTVKLPEIIVSPLNACPVLPVMANCPELSVSVTLPMVIDPGPTYKLLQRLLGDPKSYAISVAGLKLE